FHCRVPGRWPGHHPGLCLSLLPGQDRHTHSEYRRYRPYRAWPAGADHHRRVAQEDPDGESNGPDRGRPGVAESDAHHQSPGAQPERAQLCRSGASVGHEWAGDYRQGTHAQPPAVPGSDTGERGVLSHPGLYWPGGSGPWPRRCPHPGDDTLLGPLQRGAHQWLVVVVAGPPRNYPHRVSRPVLPDCGLRRDRQPETQEGRMTPDVLRVHDLLVYYHPPAGAVTAVNHISFSLKAGERLGLAGESGSGKSTLALSILRLLKPPGRVAAGEVWLGDVNLMTLAEED